MLEKCNILSADNKTVTWFYMMNEMGDKIITRINSRNSTYEIKVIVHESVLFYSSITKDDCTQKSINFSRIFTMFGDEHRNKSC